MPPIEGFLVKGAEASGTVHSRAAEDVNTDLVSAYQQIADRSGEIIAKEVLLTPLTEGAEGQIHARYRQDTHLIVDFPK